MENERKDNNYFFDSGNLSPAALERKHRIETDPSVRTDIMEYLPGMEVIHSDIRDKSCAFGKDSRIRSGHMRMRAEYRRDPAVVIPCERLFFTGRLSVKINDGGIDRL